MARFRLRPSPTVVMLFAFAAPLVVGGAPFQAVGQTNPIMTSVVPDNGGGTLQGTLQTVGAGGGTVTIVPTSGDPVTLAVAPGVDVSGVGLGDRVRAQWTRTVVFAVAPPGAPAVGKPTESVEQLATTPGGIGSGATEIVGRLVKIDGTHSFSIVNSNGGGVYTVNITDPTRAEMASKLKVGDALTIAVSATTLTSISKCGFFGC